MGVTLIVLGYDNTFGSDGVNLSVADYKDLGARYGIEVVESPELKDISSSAIRRAVISGDMEKAAAMLGHSYVLTGIVERGNGIGRELGYPTANLRAEAGCAIPREGVYAARIKLPDNKIYPAMINIGRRPTVELGDDLVIEVHIIGWEGDLYGRRVEVEFVKYIREEKKFDSLDSLKEQLRKDRSMVFDLAL